MCRQMVVPLGLVLISTTSHSWRVTHRPAVARVGRARLPREGVGDVAAVPDLAQDFSARGP
jgi:hypothetical protein